MQIIDKLKAALGARHVLTGAEAQGYARDWTGAYSWTPLAVLRPGSTSEVSAVLRLAHEAGVPVVPVGGNTGLSGGTQAEGALMLSLERMRAIREVRPEARLAVVEAGAILSEIHDAAAEHGLTFPLTFGARGSARIGGCLATNAGGSNVLRYGNARDLCLGLEVVLADGRVMNLMSELHKDNSGFNLRHLMIGSEGTLGVITAAVLKLHPAPRAHATAMVAAPDLAGALSLLNRLQEATGGRVEAFEFMPRRYIEAHLAQTPGAREPFAAPQAVNILLEVGSTVAEECTPDEAGRLPLVDRVEAILAGLFESGALVDAVVAQNEAQRAEMWARREAAAELALHRKPIVNNDIAVPLDRVEEFLSRMAARLPELDEGAEAFTVAHLGDGNVHYTIWPRTDDPARHDAMMEAVEEVALSLGGSFSAEHGIGTSKKPSMARRKDPVALEAMRAIKAALDPKGILNPGKVLPEG